MYEERYTRKPTGQELLDAISIALHTKSEMLYEDAARLCVQRVTVETSVGQLTSSKDSHVPDDLTDAFWAVFTYIADSYEDAVERKPRLSELTACLNFVLGANTERYITGDVKICGNGFQIEAVERSEER